MKYEVIREPTAQENGVGYIVTLDGKKQPVIYRRDASGAILVDWDSPARSRVWAGCFVKEILVDGETQDRWFYEGSEQEVTK
jgi:hypothetical protein